MFFLTEARLKERSEKKTHTNTPSPHIAHNFCSSGMAVGHRLISRTPYHGENTHTDISSPHIAHNFRSSDTAADHRLFSPTPDHGDDKYSSSTPHLCKHKQSYFPRSIWLLSDSTSLQYALSHPRRLMNSSSGILPSWLCNHPSLLLSMRIMLWKNRSSWAQRNNVIIDTSTSYSLKININ